MANTGYTLLQATHAVIAEVKRAKELWPQSAHSAHEAYAILAEEVDELWDVVKEKQSTPGRNDRLRKEAIQVAAMALRFLIEMPDFIC